MSQNQIRNIVLVHGFWTDAAAYRSIITSLLAEGYEAIAVQNPLTSLADDVAATQRALSRLQGACLLVGHSWGGMVITEAGNDDRVAGLVYLGALAPDAGESMIELMSPYGSPPPYFQEQEGFLWISEEGVEQVLASDLSAEQIALIHATQITPAVSLYEEKAGVPAWREKPSWYLVLENDRAVPPDLQRRFAERMGAKTVAIASSHVVMISQVEAVLNMIREATRYERT